MDNKFCNEQKEKYAGKKVQGSQGDTGAADPALTQENAWLNQKIEELQDELKRRVQIINKLKRGWMINIIIIHLFHYTYNSGR